MKDYLELSKKHFDEQAEEYDQNDTINYSKYPKISCADVVARLKGVSYKKLLDVGCGTGHLIDLLQRNHPATFFGLDLSPKMLHVAKNKLGNTVQLQEGSADTLPYTNNFFDVITCVQSFHHYPDPAKSMQEVYRVLKPGGLYILSDTGMGGIPKWLNNHLFLRFMNTGDYAVYSKKEIGNMMLQSGFAVKESQQIKKMVYTVVGQKQ